MVFIGQRYLRNAPWITLFPGIAIVITVMAFYLLGDGISAVLNPRRQAFTPAPVVYRVKRLCGRDSCFCERIISGRRFESLH